MMKQALPAQAFLRQRDQEGWVVADVRSPGEYEDGHIPGAVNIPLFENHERAEIGTLYKQESRDAAFIRGLEVVGPKLADFVKQAEACSPEKKILVHCWRGGMRSQSLATLWSQAGFEVKMLEGGYKAYRQHIREATEQRMKLIILGGKTGSGKTDVLKSLEQLGEQVIDLEGLARHKGSAFGGMLEAEQDTNEQFDNNLHEVIRTLDLEKAVWIEDESRMIGRIFVTQGIWNQMKEAPLVVLDIPRPCRVDRLVQDYADGNESQVLEAIGKIAKRMDGPVVREAIEAVKAKDAEKAADLLLEYYDKYYIRSLAKRKQDHLMKLTLDHGDAEEIARRAQQMKADLLKVYDGN